MGARVCCVLWCLRCADVKCTPSFCGWGLCAVTRGRVSHGGHTIPESVTVCVPSAPNLLDAEHAGDCCPLVCTVVSRSHCKAWCQLLACRLREGSKHGTAAPSRRGSASHPHYPDWFMPADIVRYCRRFSTPWFQRLRCTAASPRNHHGTVAPPES